MATYLPTLDPFAKRNLLASLNLSGLSAVSNPDLTADLLTEFATDRWQILPQVSIFTDNTHQIYLLKSAQQSLVLKVLRADNLAKNPFWQLITELFGLDLRQHLNNQAWLSNQFSNFAIKTPEILALANPTDNLQGFVLAKFCAGEVADSANQAWLNQQNLQILAEFLFKLHDLRFANWGVWQQQLNPAKTAANWSPSLHKQLAKLAQEMAVNQPQAQNLIAAALAQAENLPATDFVPVMLDLRWDQFLLQADKLDCLVDLDAFVLAPEQLSWLILEYLLDQNQAWLLQQSYQQLGGQLPDLTASRQAYRLWLFGLNILGATDLVNWMQHPIRFKPKILVIAAT